MSHWEFTVWCSCRGKTLSAERESKRGGNAGDFTSDSKEQPLEHRMLGQGDPGQETPRFRDHLKVDTARMWL